MKEESVEYNVPSELYTVNPEIPNDEFDTDSPFAIDPKIYFTSNEIGELVDYTILDKNKYFFASSLVIGGNGIYYSLQLQLRP